MIEHVRRRALMADGIEEVYVATGDEEIKKIITGYGGKVITTSKNHKNGTTRVAEAVQDLDCSHVVLIQGDEPLLLPNHIEQLLIEMRSSTFPSAWNATGSIYSSKELDRKSFVKCIVSSSNRILFCFRRSPSYANFETQQKYTRKILGLISYRKDTLTKLPDLHHSQVEVADFIEQLRLIEHGYHLQSVQVEPSLPSVNEACDEQEVLRYLQDNKIQSELLKKVLS